mmetsp:Transcript_12269/g.6113  ORF Transcript_12269/g.6113 Transcript_12269/m.6113 type:complete len:94 (-) Transcript_12269:23-304(-)
MFVGFAVAGIYVPFTVIYLYTGEYYPTRVRTTAIGFSSTCARIGGIFSPTLCTMLSYVNPSIPYLIFGTLGALACIVNYSLEVETLNRPLDTK